MTRSKRPDRSRTKRKTRSSKMRSKRRGRSRTIEGGGEVRGGAKDEVDAGQSGEGGVRGGRA